MSLKDKINKWIQDDVQSRVAQYFQTGIGAASNKSSFLSQASSAINSDGTSVTVTVDADGNKREAIIFGTPQSIDATVPINSNTAVMIDERRRRLNDGGSTGIGYVALYTGTKVVVRQMSTSTTDYVDVSGLLPANVLLINYQVLFSGDGKHMAVCGYAKKGDPTPNPLVVSDYDMFAYWNIYANFEIKSVSGAAGTEAAIIAAITSTVPTRKAVYAITTITVGSTVTVDYILCDLPGINPSYAGTVIGDSYNITANVKGVVTPPSMGTTRAQSLYFLFPDPLAITNKFSPVSLASVDATTAQYFVGNIGTGGLPVFYDQEFIGHYAATWSSTPSLPFFRTVLFSFNYELVGDLNTSAPVLDVVASFDNATTYQMTNENFINDYFDHVIVGSPPNGCPSSDYHCEFTQTGNYNYTYSAFLDNYPYLPPFSAHINSTPGQTFNQATTQNTVTFKNGQCSDISGGHTNTQTLQETDGQISGFVGAGDISLCVAQGSQGCLSINPYDTYAWFITAFDGTVKDVSADPTYAIPDLAGFTTIPGFYNGVAVPFFGGCFVTLYGPQNGGIAAIQFGRDTVEILRLNIITGTATVGIIDKAPNPTDTNQSITDYDLLVSVFRSVDGATAAIYKHTSLNSYFWAENSYIDNGINGTPLPPDVVSDRIYSGPGAFPFANNILKATDSFVIQGYTANSGNETITIYTVGLTGATSAGLSLTGKTIDGQVIGYILKKD